MSFECQVAELAPRITLVRRTHTNLNDLGALLKQVYQDIHAYLLELGTEPAGAPFVAYLNQDLQHLDVEIGFPIAKKVPPFHGFEISELPGGTAVTCTYTGPYNQIGLAHEGMRHWMHDKGYEEKGVVYEYHLSDPATTAPQNLVTKIVCPVTALAAAPAR